MTPAEYTIAAERTINHDLTPREQMRAQMMGIVVETAEILGEYKRHLYQGKPLDVNAVLDECGDVLWSVANLRRMRGEKFDPIGAIGIFPSSIAPSSGVGFERLHTLMASALNPNDLTHFEARLAALIIENGGTVEGVMIRNVAKLKARYPAGFPVTEEENVRRLIVDHLARCRCDSCQEAN